jgi:hypothetical protein
MKNDPAFPHTAKYCIGHDVNGAPIYGEDSFPGMTLRDYFAGQAIKMAAHRTPEQIATEAYRLADAMLDARNW